MKTVFPVLPHRSNRRARGKCDARRGIVASADSARNDVADSLLFIASVFLFLRAGKFFNGRNETLKINQPDTATSAVTFQTVRFDLAGFAEQINLRA